MNSFAQVARIELAFSGLHRFWMLWRHWG